MRHPIGILQHIDEPLALGHVDREAMRLPDDSG
jgi:hypothetical protein